MNDIVKTEDAPLVVQGETNMAQQMIKLASDPSMDVEKLKALIGMQEHMEDRDAERALSSALVEFKKNPPRIIKNMAVSFKATNYKHASIDSVLRQIDPALHPYGLSYTWKIDAQPDLVTVIGVLRHKLGASEESKFASKPDTSGGKNAIQAQGSAVTYGKRYTVLASLGLAEQGEDDDGMQGHLKQAIDDDQLNVLIDLIEKTDSNIQVLCKFFKVGSLPELANDQYGAAISMLNAKARKSSS